MSAALADFCTFSGGGKLKLSKQHYVSEGFPAFSAAGQDGYVATAEFHAPAIVVSAIGARCGKAFLAEGAWTSLANTYCVFPDTSKADPRFVWYQLNDESSWKKSGSAQPFIKPNDIKQRHVALPPLEEQRRIVGLLDRAAEIRSRADAARTKARAIIPALFLDMFGDPATNPMGWPIVQLGDFLTHLTSGSRAWKQYYSDNGARFIRVQNVKRNVLDLSDVAYVSPPDNAETNRTKVRSGDLVLTITGSPGIAAPVIDLMETYYVNQHVALVRPVEALNSTYLSCFINAPRGGSAQLGQSAYGQTRPGLGLGEIRKLAVPLPPLPLQTAFAEQAKRLEANARALDTAAAKAEAMAASLSAEVFDCASLCGSGTPS